MRIFDISRKLVNGMPVWPGDTAFQYEVSWPMEESGSVNVGRLELSTHTGTHVDAPFHFDNDGKRISELDLNLYIGPARVIDLPPEIESISIEELKEVDLDGVTRVLFRTCAWKNGTVFPEKIPHIEPELAPYLAKKGIRLIGLDVPSVDPIDSKELPAHHSLNENGIHILESLILDKIVPGDYELIALPLPLVEGDGSPVRAILRQW
ncbi:arylformamidase [Neobacillus vireti]|uniref:Kynurenine formamidase n=1 Tax=Neobacillus vireti LMG 21834 TaxID=1131730 RepID=A0AB94IU51_9BACI|nr:arylformamidase [Neobacillus vireti]ETI70611.1 metal-dependent hydrolase [Neobacillus vireti LMG 21834]KLT15314.1 kynurenine formamidase [Neobacillus vireti]